MNNNVHVWYGVLYSEVCRSRAEPSRVRIVLVDSGGGRACLVRLLCALADRSSCAVCDVGGEKVKINRRCSNCWDG